MVSHTMLVPEPEEGYEIIDEHHNSSSVSGLRKAAAYGRFGEYAQTGRLHHMPGTDFGNYGRRQTADDNYKFT